MAQRSKVSWFFAGIVSSVLVTAAANALSYFIRSESWTPLFHPRAMPQALGFPFEIWRFGIVYENGAMIDSHAMNTNAFLAIIGGAVLGIVFASFSPRLNRFVDFMIEAEGKNAKPISWQFSTGGLLIFTTVVAALFALARAAIGATPQLLGAIYLLGPVSLVLLSMVPRGLSWQHRVVLLAPSTLMLIGFAMLVGVRQSLPFEHVMMGIFVCWVPQTVFAAAVIMIWMAFQWGRTSIASASAR